MSDNATLTGVQSAVGVLTGVLTPADTGDFVADYATDAECVAVIDDIFDILLKGQEKYGCY